MKILEHYTYTGYKTSVYKQPSPLTRQYMITTSTKPEYSTILNTLCVLHFALYFNDDDPHGGDAYHEGLYDDTRLQVRQSGVIRNH